MADHPQGSPRGLFIKGKITVANTTGTVTLTPVSGGGLKVANSTGNASMTPYSGGVTLDGGIGFSGKTKGRITANSTGAIVADALRIGTKAVYITSNSTGVLLNGKYITTNTTGN